MKKLLFIASILLVSLNGAFAQAKTKALKKSLSLAIPREGGANGASVAWHPIQKKYYASMAGNASFPIGVYNVTGKLLSSEEQETMFDMRGLWYNPSSKTLQMNGYDDLGWAEYKLDPRGFPSEAIPLVEEMKQPNEQSGGSFNPTTKMVYFFNDEGNIDVYSLPDAIYEESISLYLGTAAESDKDAEGNLLLLADYNATCVIYTGIKGGEVGLLNHSGRQIELYDLKTGLMTQKLTFPSEVVIPEYLNFSFANGMYWIFDKEARVWNGYK